MIVSMQKGHPQESESGASPKRDELLTAWLVLFKLKINGIASDELEGPIMDLLRIIDTEQGKLIDEQEASHG